MADPTPPPKPATVPAWALRAIAVLLPVSGLALDWVDPTGKFNKAGVQALIVIVFTVLGALVFTFHFVLAAIHAHGWSIASAKLIEDDIITEARSVVPQIKTEWATAAPFVKELPGVSDRLGEVEAGLAGVQESIAGIPDGDKEAATAAVLDWLKTTRLGPLLEDAPPIGPAKPAASATVVTTVPNHGNATFASGGSGGLTFPMGGGAGGGATGAPVPAEPAPAAPAAPAAVAEPIPSAPVDETIPATQQG